MCLQTCRLFTVSAGEAGGNADIRYGSLSKGDASRQSKTIGYGQRIGTGHQELLV